DGIRCWSVTGVQTCALPIFFSLTLVPLLCFWLLGRGVKHEQNRLVDVMTRIYRRALDRSLRRPALVIGAAVAGLAVALALVPRGAGEGRVGVGGRARQAWT